ncbi:hypothetical protein DFH28DRAFT_951922 [Melampsora americana]|nr:hypothetical protein DFH28DRAFT_951922 [Melampsora americana]
MFVFRNLISHRWIGLISFSLLTRLILLSIESGQIDPKRNGSGIRYGERTLKTLVLGCC